MVEGWDSYLAPRDVLGAVSDGRDWACLRCGRRYYPDTSGWAGDRDNARCGLAEGERDVRFLTEMVKLWLFRCLPVAELRVVLVPVSPTGTWKAATRSAGRPHQRFQQVRLRLPAPLPECCCLPDRQRSHWPAGLPHEGDCPSSALALQPAFSTCLAPLFNHHVT